MSFPKARRFNELKNGVPAPGPGSYDPKAQEKVPSAFIDGKDVRFKLDKDKLNLPGPGAFDMSCLSAIQTPKKSAPGALNNESKVNHGIVRKPPVVDVKVKELESELRHALQERADMSKRLRQREEESSRFDGRLLQKNRDLSAQQASAAALEKQLNDLKKAHQTLKQKISSTEDNSNKSKEIVSTLKKRITEFDSSKLKAENEKQTLKKQVEEMKKEKQTSLILQSELKHKVESLEKMQNVVAKSNEEKLQQKDDDLKAETERLKSEILERVEDALKSVENSDAESIATLEAAKHSYETATEEHLVSLRRTINAMKLEKFEDESLIRHLKGEIFFIADEAQAEKIGIFKAGEKVEILLLQIQKLEESENLLNENIRRITSKYEDIEADLVNLESESRLREQQLIRQLNATQSSRSQLQTEHEQLLQRHLKLAQTLTQTHDDLNAEVKEVTKQREITAIELALVQSSLKAMEEKNAHQAAMVEELEEKNMQLGLELQTVKHKLQEVENVSREREKLMEEWKRQKDEMEAEISQRLKETEEKLAKKEEDVREVEEILSEQLLENEERSKEEEEMTGALKHEIDLAYVELQKLKEEQQRLLRRICTSQSEAENLGQVNRELTLKVGQLEVKICDLEESEKEKERKVKVLLSEYEERFEEQENVEILMAEEMREKEEEAETYKRMALDQMSLHEHMEVVLKRMRCDVETRKDNERSLRKTDAELRTKIDVLENEAEKSRDELEKISEIKMESQLRSLQANEAVKRVAQLEEELKTMTAIVVERESQLREFASSACNDQEILERKIERCEQDLLTKNEMIVNTKQLLELSNSNVEHLQRNIDELKTQFGSGEEAAQLRIDLEDGKLAMESYRSQAESEIRKHREMLRLWEQRERLWRSQMSDASIWKERFLELEKRAEPFKLQMEAYANERADILGRSRDVEREMQELAQKYASLLGHQNTKQKIRHVEKLKEENVKLKQELSSLNASNSKQKKQLTKLQEKVDRFEGKKRFDVSKAFVAQKENLDPPRSPLTQGNR